jgi:hypothetical protein
VKDGDIKAFPLAIPYGVSEINSGMTLRDWFAGMALMGIIANRETVIRKQDGPSNVCPAAYGMADAMIAERSKSK